MTLAATPTRAAVRPAFAINAETWLVRFAWLVVALSCVQILLFGFGRDQGIYATVADSVLAGGMPYRDAWDFKPPGIFVVYAAAQALFGRAMTSVRIVEVASLLVLVASFRRISGRMFGSRTPGLLGGALAMLVHAQLEFWHTAQPEAFGGVLTAVALDLATEAASSTVAATHVFRRIGAWCAVGAAFGAAFLLKPPLGGGALVCAAYLGRAEQLRARRAVAGLAPVLPILVVGAASLVPIAACGLWFWTRGALPALRWTFVEFVPGYTALGWGGSAARLYLYGLQEGLIGFSHVIPAGILLAVVLPRVADREREALFLFAGVVSVHVAGIALQAKFFQYHYAATLPLLAFVAGLGLYKAWRRALLLPAVGVPVFAAALVALTVSQVALRHNPGTFWERSAARLRFLATRDVSRADLDALLYHVVDYSLDTDRRVARAAAVLSGPGDSIFVWGFEPAIYWLSGRSAASRYVYDVPQRARWQRDRARAELMADLERRRPRVMAVQHGDTFDFVTGDALDSAESLGGFPELAAFLHRDYRFIETIDDIDVYRRWPHP